MERPKTDIFDTFFFNNIMEVTFIFSPRVLRDKIAGEYCNTFIFNNIYFSKIFAANR